MRIIPNSRPAVFAAGLLALTLPAALYARQTAAAPKPPANLLPEGAFDSSDGWQLDAATMKVVEEGGRRFVRLTNDSTDKAVALTRSVALPAGAKFVTVSVRMRVSGLKLGKEGWHEPRVALRFTDDKGDQKGGYPPMPNLRADAAEWTLREVQIVVPDGATRLQLQPGLWLAAGTLDLDDLTVRAYPSAAEYYASVARPLTPALSPADWSAPNAADFAPAQGDGGTPVFRIKSASGEAELSAAGVYALRPDWAGLDLTLRARVSGHAPGGANWKAARVLAQFLDGDGKNVGEATLASIGGDTKGFEEFRAHADLPEGARFVRFTAGFDHAKGTLDIASLGAAPQSAAALADAPAPADLDWGKEAVTPTSGKRGRMSLNGTWKFLPAVGEAERDPKAGWGYVKVPADWKRGDAFVARGSGRLWQNFKGDALPQAWYERTVTVPADWAGRAVLLDLRRVSTDAVVYVDGREAGRVVWPSGTVDLTPYVEAGKTHTLRVRVIATDDGKEVVSYMGFDQIERRPAQLDTRGLIGDVTLLSRPRGAYVDDVFVRPSVRKKTLGLDVTVAGVAAPGEATFTAKLLDEKGNVERTFTQKVALKASPGPQTVALSFPWADPRLWDLKRPNLYTLRLEASGAGLDDDYPQEFGFREFWVEGRKFFLNGTEFRLRPNLINTGAANGGAVHEAAKLLDAGYNFGEYWPDDIGRRGTFANVDPIYADADRAGLPVSANLLSTPPYLDPAGWGDSVKAEYRRHIETELRRIRNHPSVIMYSTSANAFGNGMDEDPRVLGRVGYSSVQEYAERRKRFDELAGLTKSFDPTRPIFTHHGAYYGDFQTCNMYLNVIPLQEREEWLSAWAAAGETPFSAIEFGTPLYSTFLRGRNGYGETGRTEPLMTEFCAIYFGSRAYTTEPKDYRERIPATFKGDQTYDSWFQFGDKSLVRAPAFQDLQRLFITNTWRSWRTWGLSGGMVPWEGGHESPAVGENNGPTLAWIAGPQKAFTEKSHTFFGGAPVAKSVVLINDERSGQPYTASWAVTVGGKTVASGSKSGTLATAMNLFLPVAFTAPAVAAKTDGKITLTAKIGGREHRDTFAFRVFPAAPARPAASAAAPAVHVFDPAGETTAMLRSLGYAVTPVRAGGALPKSGTLVVGRRALSNRALVPGNLAAFVRGGGRVLVMGQDPDWVRLSWHLRVAPHVSRRAFAVSPAHPALAGLDDDDLRDWAGASTLVAARPAYPGFEWTPRYGWHWGNTGGVSSAPVEKPHMGSWRPILEGEFDLAYSPLMEMEYGRGRVTLCTLDVEDYVARDPAARRLAKQVVERARTAPAAPKAAKVAYVGGEAGAKTLDALGVRYAKASAPDPAAGLLVVGPDARVDDPTLTRYLSAGGRALFLMRRAEGPVALGAAVTKAANFNGSLKPPTTWPEAAGLSASDLRWRAPYDAYLVGGPGVEVGADGMLGRKKVGKGVAVFAQIDPDYLPAGEKTYFRFTRWRQTRALSQVFANLGATFAQDERTLALLSRPDQGYMLAGTWDARLTNPVPEAPTRVPHGDPGMSDAAKGLLGVSVAAAGWQKVPVPAYQESYGGKWRWTDGEAVFRTAVDIPAYLAGRDLYLSVGRVDETDETFFNGEKVGKTHEWLAPRGYKVPGRLVKAGRNVIAIRTWDEMIHGGVCGDPTQLFLRVDGADPGFYHPDYRDDYGLKEFELADNPYRYFRW